MQGLFVEGERPRSKKQVREYVAAGELHQISVEATSWFGDEYDGNLSNWDGSKPISFVGPDPYTSRRFYGTIEMKNGKVMVR